MKNQGSRQQTFKQQGFTLVEISIVIIILAIITSLVFPSYKELYRQFIPHNYHILQKMISTLSV